MPIGAYGYPWFFKLSKARSGLFASSYVLGGWISMLNERQSPRCKFVLWHMVCSWFSSTVIEKITSIELLWKPVRHARGLLQKAQSAGVLSGLNIPNKKPGEPLLEWVPWRLKQQFFFHGFCMGAKIWRPVYWWESFLVWRSPFTTVAW